MSHAVCAVLYYTVARLGQCSQRWQLQRPCMHSSTHAHPAAGPRRDLHSGNEGGVFCEPLVDLNKVLASLVDARSNIQVGALFAASHVLAGC